MSGLRGAAAGISPGLVRVSVGYTGALEQRWKQLLGTLGEIGLVAAGTAESPPEP